LPMRYRPALTGFVNMTQEILDFTRGVTSLNIAKVEFDEVMEGVLNFIEKDLSKNNVTLVRRHPIPREDRSGQEKIVRVFYNIAEPTQRRYAGRRDAESKHQQENGFVRVDFSDTGVGNTGRDQEPHLRTLRSAMGKEARNGPGMAIVKKVTTITKAGFRLKARREKAQRFRLPSEAHS